MGKLPLLSLLTFSYLFISSCSSMKTTNWSTLNGKAPLILAHRGLPGYYPDHTLEGYEKAARLGADFIEPDLVSTKDGVLIARHEPNIKDTTDVADRPEFAKLKRKQLVDGKEEEGWFANDFTLAQIKTLRAKQPMGDRDQQYNGKFQIPTFEEVLELRAKLSKELGREIGVYPETKHPAWHAENKLGFEEKLVSILEKYELNRADSPVFIQSFEMENLKKLNRLTTVKLVYLIDGDDVLDDGTVTSSRPYDFVKSGDKRVYGDMMSDAALREIREIADGIGPWKPYIATVKKSADGVTTRMPANDLVKRAHALGLVVHPFTFRNEAKRLVTGDKGDSFNEYSVFFAAGVDGLFSDHTDFAVSALKRYSK